MSSDTSYKPRKLFDSVEKEEETQTGKVRLAIKVKIIVTWKLGEVSVWRMSSPKVKI